MIVVYLLVGAIGWPIVTYSVIALGNKVLMPFFNFLLLKRDRSAVVQHLRWRGSLIDDPEGAVFNGYFERVCYHLTNWS